MQIQMEDSCVALALSVPPSPALSMATKSVEELCARLKTGGIPDQFCEAFKGKVAKFCLVCSNSSSYGIAGYFRGVLISLFSWLSHMARSFPPMKISAQRVRRC